MRADGTIDVVESEFPERARRETGRNVAAGLPVGGGDHAKLGCAR